jgi:hypothetical protein
LVVEVKRRYLGIFSARVSTLSSSERAMQRNSVVIASTMQSE